MLRACVNSSNRFNGFPSPDGAEAKRETAKAVGSSPSGLSTPLKRGVNARGWATPRKRLNHGFTLVELLLVLVILGILAAIVIPKFSGRTEQAKQQAAVTQIGTFKTALETFEVDNGYYPKGKNGLLDLIQAPKDAQNWRGPYIQSDTIPKDPWGNDYIYECPGRHNPTSYDVSSSGPPGADKPIGNWTIQNR